MTPTPLDPERLADYAEGRLDGVERAVVERSLGKDPESAAVARTLRAAIELMRGDDSVEPSPSLMDRAKGIFVARSRTSWIDRARAIVAAVVFDSAAEPNVAGLRRAAGSGRQMSFECGIATIDLEFQPDETDRPRAPARLVGQITVAGDAGGTIEAAMTEPSGLSYPVEVDDDGAFVVSITPGRYDLFLRIREHVIVVSDLDCP